MHRQKTVVSTTCGHSAGSGMNRQLAPGFKQCEEKLHIKAAGYKLICKCNCLMPKSLTCPEIQVTGALGKKPIKAGIQYYMTILFNLLDTHLSLPWATRAETASTVIFTCILLDYGKTNFSCVFHWKRKGTESYRERKFPVQQSS